MARKQQRSPGKRKRRSRSQPGSRPGEIVVSPAAMATQLTVVGYCSKKLAEYAPGDVQLEDLPSLQQKHDVLWVNVTGLGDKQEMMALAELFKLHPLALEDVVNVPQRPKVESYDDQLFLVVQLLRRKEEVKLSQISLCLGEGFLLTFQESSGDPFKVVRKRLQQTHGRLRQSGADYLAYALMDAVIDHYFPALESLQDSLEALELELRTPQKNALEKIQAARAELAEAQRTLAPLREVMRGLLNGDWPHLNEPTLVYLRDCRDHVLEATEQLDACRSIAASLMDVHLSTVNHQANTTMKVLTIIATIFMPLSFLAGIYGMNFDPGVSQWNMPELRSPFGYPVLLGVMALTGACLMAFFWRKGWFD